ncbi:MAG: beta-ketoacyl-[acyl-carrier-protein] synthase family protein [Opitutaceae bacterium]
MKITGIGPVTPAGIGRETFWKGILEPVSRVRPYEKLGAEYGPIVAAFVDGFNIADYVPPDELPNGLPRHTEFAIAGSILALRDAGLTSQETRKSECAIVTGSSLMDFGSIAKAIGGVERFGSRGANPRMVYTAPLTNVVESVSHILRLNARTMTIQSSCCSGLDAIGYAFELIASGEVDLAICGGIEAPLMRTPILELRAAGLTPGTAEMPERLARPFDLWRTTGVVSEGGCMFILEPEKSSRPGYAYISGWASATDENGTLCSGLVRAMKQALACAALRPSQIEGISAWAPGHKAIDKGEVAALREVFGDRLPQIPASSIKGAVGAALGAAPAIQVAAAALGLNRKMLTPTVNWAFPDPECDLNLCDCKRDLRLANVIVNAHGVGRINSSLILESCS